jgi:hypothetical protein
VARLQAAEWQPQFAECVHALGNLCHPYFYAGPTYALRKDLAPLLRVLKKGSLCSKQHAVSCLQRIARQVPAAKPETCAALRQCFDDLTQGHDFSENARPQAHQWPPEWGLYDLLRSALSANCADGRR